MALLNQWRYPNHAAAGARALGVLETLLANGHVPPVHIKRVRNILAQADTEGFADQWDDNAEVPT